MPYEASAELKQASPEQPDTEQVPLNLPSPSPTTVEEIPKFHQEGSNAENEEKQLESKSITFAPGSAMNSQEPHAHVPEKLKHPKNFDSDKVAKLNFPDLPGSTKNDDKAPRLSIELEPSRIKVETMNIDTVKASRPRSAHSGSVRSNTAPPSDNKQSRSARGPAKLVQPSRRKKSSTQVRTDRNQSQSPRDLQVASPSPRRRPKSSYGVRTPHGHALERADKRNAQLLAENLLLKAEVERLNRYQHQLPANQQQQQEDHTVYPQQTVDFLKPSSNWALQVPIRSTGEYRERPKTAGTFLLNGTMTPQERTELAKQFSRASKPTREDALRRREASWDSTTSVPRNLLSRYLPPPIKQPPNHVLQAAKPETKHLLPRRPSRPATAMPKSKRGKRLVASLANPKSGGKPHRPRHVERNDLSRKKEAADFGPRTGSPPLRPAYLDDTEASPRHHRLENSQEYVNWTQQGLFLESSERLRASSRDMSQMDVLLRAIDNPKHLKTSYEQACGLVEKLWADLCTNDKETQEFRTEFFGECSTGNYAHVLSYMTRLTSLRNKLLNVFELIKRRERLVDSMSKVLNPLDTRPQSPSRVTSAAEEMVELRSLNHSVLALISEISRETGEPLVLHGLNYAHKVRCDLVLP